MRVLIYVQCKQCTQSAVSAALLCHKLAVQLDWSHVGDAVPISKVFRPSLITAATLAHKLDVQHRV